MIVTLDLDDALIKKAAKVTGVSDIDALMRLGLQALVGKKSAKSLAGMGGTENGLDVIPRRKSV